MIFFKIRFLQLRLLKKFHSFVQTVNKLGIRGSLKYYFIKYFSKNREKEFKLILSSDLKVNLKNSAGDLCTLYEIFVEEDYRMDTYSKDQKLNILDIGANIGYFSLYAANRFGLSTVFSFEPFPQTFERFLNNISQNGISRIKPFNLAVSDVDGKVDFFSVDWAGCNTMIGGKFDEGHYTKTEVDCISFKNIFRMTGQKVFDFAKIDCEGSEYSIILNSGDEVLRSVKVYSIEVHIEKEHKAEELIKRFKDLDYSVTFTDNILKATRN